MKFVTDFVGIRHVRKIAGMMLRVVGNEHLAWIVEQKPAVLLKVSI